MAAFEVTEFFVRHEATLNRAIDAIHERLFYAHYPESPSGKIYGETANDEGRAAFEAQLGRLFDLRQQADRSLVSDEVSPFTLNPLHISYPVHDAPEAYISASQAAAPAWQRLDAYIRAGILVESLEGVRRRFFELAYATMHTTGQAFVMSFQASGPHAADRALEAVALGLHEQTRFPGRTVEWVKPMGKGEVRIDKRWHNVPRGVSLCIGVSTFPVWNTLPGLYASLVTGNTAIVKPHPAAVYPLALVVQEIQRALEAVGLDPQIVQLATDTAAEPITTQLAAHPDVRIIDFTGGSQYGAYVESLADKIVFTEKSGVNSVIIDSVEDLKAAMGNLAMSVSLYSGQMCTAPQNFFIPEGGIEAGGSHASYESVVAALTGAIQALAADPRMAPNILGAIQSPRTLDRSQQARLLDARLLLDPQPAPNPEYPEARIAAPLVLEVRADRKDVFGQELFGPVVLVIPTRNTPHSVALARELALEKGAISCAAYTTDEEMMELIESEMTSAGAPVSFNFSGPVLINQNATFSDFHVTGANPAGNASISDPSFIRRRFSVVGTRVYKP